MLIFLDKRQNCVYSLYKRKIITIFNIACICEFIMFCISHTHTFIHNRFSWLYMWTGNVCLSIYFPNMYTQWFLGINFPMSIWSNMANGNKQTIWPHYICYVVCLSTNKINMIFFQKWKRKIYSYMYMKRKHFAVIMCILKKTLISVKSYKI